MRLSALLLACLLAPCSSGRRGAGEPPVPHDGEGLVGPHARLHVGADSRPDISADVSAPTKGCAPHQRGTLPA